MNLKISRTSGFRLLQECPSLFNIKQNQYFRHIQPEENFFHRNVQLKRIRIHHINTIYRITWKFTALLKSTSAIGQEDPRL